MALCATRMIAEKRLRKKTLVATVMSNLGLEKAIAKAGGTLLRTPVGDRYVMEAMRSHDLSLGGEQSGHLIFSEHGTTGDGIVAALQVLAIYVREGKPISELRKVMQPLPQVLKSVSLRERAPVDEMRQRVEKALGHDGRVLIRWSGTENKLRIMLEGPELPALQNWLTSLVHAAERDLGAAKT
jgi:phosphoglucosamine mutase